MRFSVFTASTPEWTPEQAAGTLAAQGWDGIEWRIVDQADADPPGFWAGNRATWPLTGLEAALPEIARTARDAGLAVSGIGGYARAAAHDDVHRLLRATAALGAERVRVVMPPAGTDYREAFAAARRDLEWIAPRAADLGVTALVELHHGTITASASAAVRLLDGLDPDCVGVIHDVGNLLVEGWEDLDAALALLGPYLAHVHVKNARWFDTGETDGSGAARWAWTWAPLERGRADIPGYLAALARAGWDGWVTCEDFSTERPLEERLAHDLAFLTAAARRG